MTKAGLALRGEARGIRVRVVVALDDPDLIVTIHRGRR
jgi:hypothetical protein